MVWDERHAKIFQLRQYCCKAQILVLKTLTWREEKKCCVRDAEFDARPGVYDSIQSAQLTIKQVFFSHCLSSYKIGFQSQKKTLEIASIQPQQQKKSGDQSGKSVACYQTHWIPIPIKPSYFMTFVAFKGQRAFQKAALYYVYVQDFNILLPWNHTCQLAGNWAWQCLEEKFVCLLVCLSSSISVLFTMVVNSFIEQNRPRCCNV